MRLFVLTALTMIAFAANSVLNRLAVGPGLIDPVSFAVVRLLAGAAILSALVVARRRVGAWTSRRRLLGAGALLVYLFGFSMAYGALDAGIGALILFGCVQITMFAGALVAHDPIPPRRWIGAGLAFAGLVVLLAPGGGGAVPPGAAAAMAAAGLGWGVYSLTGRAEKDALGATAANFVWAIPAALVLTSMALPSGAIVARPAGLGLAVLSGAVTSGLGYALWFRLLPRLGSTRAAVAQLTVPLIAALGGLVLIGESVTLRFGIATVLVLGGVALASLARRR